VRPFQWRIKEGKSTLIEARYPEPVALTPEVSINLIMGTYNKFKYVVTGKKMSLYINEELIQEAAVPNFPAVASVVCDTDDEVIIKAVNIAAESDDINIDLDCDVENDYKVGLLMGEKYDENTIDNPTKVHDIEVMLSGASKHFIYHAPAYSINIIHLKKR
jgi:hypothetical protein